VRASSEGLPLPRRTSTIPATPAAGRGHQKGSGKDSEEYLEDFREIWRILGEEFV
jgi:hypothetical protein